MRRTDGKIKGSGSRGSWTSVAVWRRAVVNGLFLFSTLKRTTILVIPMTKYCQKLSGLLVALVVVGGCTMLQRGGTPVESRNVQAVLSASRARQVSLFGDLPDRSAPTYYTRSPISLKRHTFAEVGADLDPDIDAGGRRILFASTRHNAQADLYFKAVDGVAVTQLTADPAADIQPMLSPDGNRVAFASDRGGTWDIWITNVGGGPPVQVTKGARDEVHPSWSPDGTQLVFCSLPKNGGQWELWIVSAAAGSTTRFIGYGLFPEWSPVTDTIVYQRAREQGSRWFSIWTVALVDGEPQYPTEIASSAVDAMVLPTWSPDGRRIAFAVMRSLPPAPDVSRPLAQESMVDVWVMEANGSGKIRLTDGHTRNCSPTFASHDRLFFTSDRSGHENIWSLLLPPGSSPSPEHFDVQTTGALGVEPDGRRPAQTAAARDGL